METISPVRPLDISGSDYRQQLRELLEYEADLERAENRERIQEEGIESLEQSDLGFIPYAQPLRFRHVRFSVAVPAGELGDTDIQERYELFEDTEVLVQTGSFEQASNGDADPVIEEELKGVIGEINDNIISIDFPAIAQSQEEYKRVQQAAVTAEFVHVGELFNRTVFEREDEAVRLLSDTKVELVCGHRSATFDPDAPAYHHTEPRDEDLYTNDRQSDAIKHALTAQDITCIQGPPGTGKTRVIVELVRRFLDAGQRVLVTAESHQAVSNILVGDSVPGAVDDECLHYHARVNGFPVNRVNPKPEKIGIFERRHYSEEQPDAPVYLSTNNSVARAVQIGSEQFDVAIIDEATQARQASTYIPFSAAQKAILVGDHKQLGPGRPYTSAIDQKPPDLDFDGQQSAFTHLYDDHHGVFGADLGVMFDTQYRMHPDIVGFPSQEFYDGKLATGTEIERLNNLQPVIGFDILDRTSSHREKNHAEAQAIAEYVSKLVRLSDVPPNEIGIATAYREQVSVLKTAMAQTDLDHTSLLIQTFDSFQGSERPVMLLSFTRSNDSGNIGFLSGETGARRLNVAMTRAKYHCAFFGDWTTLATGNSLYHRLQEYIEAHGRLIENTKKLVDN